MYYYKCEIIIIHLMFVFILYCTYLNVPSKFKFTGTSVSIAILFGDILLSPVL